ncbi:MAG: hypothetical protein Q9M91_03550 [Candidatus Dojkabacteria bacterium]|nr:hypothetical protein [Candidatus Dojkabacteria bacterium]MDQ7020896.1 hypothetical protein [Candidatus Dojkabacteria bacterium]
MKKLKYSDKDKFDSVVNYVSEDQIFASKYIDKNGGMLSTDFINVTFEEDTVSEPVILTYQVINGEPSSLGNSFELTATNLEGEEVNTFSKEVMINGILWI